MINHLKKGLASAILALSLFAFFNAPPVNATGIFLTNEYLQIAPTETYGAIVYDGKRETLLASDVFNFNPLIGWNFVWLIPVPSRPTVDIVNSELIAQIEKLANPDNEPETTKTRGVSLMSARVFEPKPGLKDLKSWLAEGGYFIPKRLGPAMDEYTNKGWYMVAVLVDGIHIQRDASEGLTLNVVHTMPVKISFDTNTIIYPMQFTAVEPDIDSAAATLIYGQKSEQVLGIKDAEIDALLARKSANLYPHLPLGHINYKTEFFIIGEDQAQAPDFTSVSQTSIDGQKFGKGSWNAFFLELPRKHLTLTHLRQLKHLEELGDVTVALKSSFWPLGIANLFTVSLFPGQVSLLFWAMLLVIFLVGIFVGKKLKIPMTQIQFISRYRRYIAAFTLAIAFGVAVLFYRGDTGAKMRANIGTVIPGDTQKSGMPGMENMSDPNGVKLSNAREIFIDSGDFFFSPKSITLRAGERVILRIRSKGLHTFTLDKLGINVETPDGEVTNVEFTPVQRGSFEFYCDIPGHRRDGQIGTLIVQ